MLTDIHEAAQARPPAQVQTFSRSPRSSAGKRTCWLPPATPVSRSTSRRGSGWPPKGWGVAEKARSGGASEVAVTERGTFFGYGDLVVDMRNFVRLREATGAPVIFDATHSVQQPGQGDGAPAGVSRSSFHRCSRRRRRGRRRVLPGDPSRSPRALSDAATQWPLDQLAELLERTLDLWGGPGY